MLIPMDRLVTEFNVRPRAILHIGAHLGEEATDYAAAGVERVLWVEANPALIKQLTNHVRQFAGQDAVQAAICDKDNISLSLYLASFSMSSSILKMKRHLDHYPTILEIGALPMLGTTADTLLKTLDIQSDTFDMANLDIEGAELLALQGMPTIIPNLKWIYSEVNTDEMYEGCVMLDDLDEFLGEQGFERIATEDAYFLGQYKGFKDVAYKRVCSN